MEEYRVFDTGKYRFGYTYTGKSHLLLILLKGDLNSEIKSNLEKILNKFNVNKVLFICEEEDKSREIYNFLSALFCTEKKLIYPFKVDKVRKMISEYEGSISNEGLIVILSEISKETLLLKEIFGKKRIEPIEKEDYKLTFFEYDGVHYFLILDKHHGKIGKDFEDDVRKVLSEISFSDGKILFVHEPVPYIIYPKMIKIGYTKKYEITVRLLKEMGSVEDRSIDSFDYPSLRRNLLEYKEKNKNGFVVILFGAYHERDIMNLIRSLALVRYQMYQHS